MWNTSERQIPSCLENATSTPPLRPLRHLPNLWPLLQIEILAPFTTPRITGRAARAGSLHRRRVGLPDCSTPADGQVSLSESDRDGAVESSLHTHAGLTQSADNRLAFDLIELSIQGNGVVIPHLAHFHVA